MNDSSTNLYCVPANVISTGARLSTASSKCLWSETCCFFLVMYIFSRVSPEIKLFFVFGFQSLVFTDGGTVLPTDKSLLGGTWEIAARLGVSSSSAC